VTVGGDWPWWETIAGSSHTWRYNGGRAYVVCTLCAERRDAITGRVITPRRRPAAR
jgi:hypothetical protein